MSRFDVVFDLLALSARRVREEANWQRLHDTKLPMTQWYHRGLLDGTRRGVMFSAGAFEEGVLEASDAFMAAQNEMDFLFGRYQEPRS